VQGAEFKYKGLHSFTIVTSMETTTPRCVLTVVPALFAGSSLGGWLALHLALAQLDKVAGLVLIAPALDFTEGMWAVLNPQQQADALRERRIPIASK
jgi:pimeloyl-ACP methyl ester carboxylesterase